MNPPSFWAHNGALYMSMKEIAALKWSSSSQSSKKLKGKVLKACDVGLLLSGGGQAPKYVHTDDVEKIVVLEMRDEARRIITWLVPCSGIIRVFQCCVNSWPKPDRL